MKRLVVPLLAVLAVSMITAPPAAAAPAAPSPRLFVDLCAQPATLQLDVAAAAALRITPGRGKKMRPAGLVKARALASQLTGGVNPCTDPLEDYQDVIAEVQSSIEAGDAQATRELLQYYIESIAPYEPEPDTTPASVQIMRRLGFAQPRSAACEGFESHDVKAPAEVALGLQLAELASLAGDDDIAQLAIEGAQKSLKNWIESDAGGNATSVPDFISLAASAQLLGLEDEVSAKLIDKAQAVALDSYKGYNVVPCRMTKEKVDCFFKAAMALQLLGSETVSNSQVTKDIESAASAARQIKAGKKPRCGIEKYAFRMKFENTVDNGQVMSFDTGRVVFTVQDGRIASSDRGPLVMSSVTDQACWVKLDDGAWSKEGSANLTGGRFPYTVDGTDDGETLNLVLAQQGSWRVTGSGSLECQMLIALADSFLNAYPQLLREGLPLPAGVSDYEETESGFEFHEPSGETRAWSSYFEFRMLEPKR